MQQNQIAIVPIDQLLPGMFVSRVTKQSGQLKVKSQGLIKRPELIAMLKKKGILELEVDYSKSNLEEIAKHQPEQTQETESVADKAPEKSLSDSLNQSQTLHDQAKQVHCKLLDKVRNGEQTNIEEIRKVSSEIIDSIFENPNALSCVSLIKDAPDYIWEHSVNSAIYMGVFARHLGFDKELTEDLCLGGFLMDIGMATIPEELLQKGDKFHAEDQEMIKMHVDFGVELVSQEENVSDVVLSVIQDHHERLDGSGYPEGKKGDQINTYGRMAAIIDSYDAMTSDRPYRKGYTPTAALKKLLSDTSGKYDQSLVQQFIRCIGVHPVGSLVKLKSGKLGIIVKANKDEPIKPLVMCFYSVTSGAHTELKRVDLAKVADEIECTVRPNEFKINLTKFFRDIFLGAI
ncbi:HD-GYP domain-containing protein [Planctobacterium marinum]|uniref:HD-GYP domain-containing protein n=1 Tax=Planctobacterium marinum TaxID=1631968 RepID=UPI001E62CF3C|nr:HD-GYP domain-containing protein [Planctobacterium marinum]MCC2603816.1 HD-GYP domain-containing protein [Planctobacterium marinum]